MMKHLVVYILRTLLFAGTKFSEISDLPNFLYPRILLNFSTFSNK